LRGGVSVSIEKTAQIAENVCAVGGIALEVGAYAAKSLGEKLLELVKCVQDEAKNGTETEAKDTCHCENILAKVKGFVKEHPVLCCTAFFGLGFLVVAHFQSRSRKKKKQKK
jgi:hypothetical protein